MRATRGPDETPEARPPAPRRPAHEHPRDAREIARLQRQMGNQAVLALLASRGGTTAGHALPAVQRRVLKGGDKPEEVRTFEQGEARAEIEDTARQLAAQHGQEIVFLRDVPSLLLTETEYVVEHGNSVSIRGAPPADVAALLADKMTKWTATPYRIVFYSCQAGVDLAAPADAVQKTLHDRYAINSQVTAPRGLVHRVGGTDLVHRRMFDIRGTASTSVDLGPDDLGDWVEVQHEAWKDIRTRLVAQCLAELRDAAVAKVATMDVAALTKLVEHLATHRHLTSQEKQTSTLLTPKRLDKKQEGVRKFLTKQSQEMSPDKFIEVITTYAAFDAIAVVNRHAEAAWQTKATLMKLSSEEETQQLLLVPGQDAWRTFVTAVAPPATTPLTAALARSQGADLGGRLLAIRAAMQGRGTHDDADSDGSDDDW